jgi:hypothetical protein
VSRRQSTESLDEAVTITADSADAHATVKQQSGHAEDSTMTVTVDEVQGQDVMEQSMGQAMAYVPIHDAHARPMDR